jgi:hypothetical protein
MNRFVLILLSAAALSGCGKSTPRVTALDFGDSISLGYSPFARSYLVGIADYRHNRWETGGIPPPSPMIVLLRGSYISAAAQEGANDGDSSSLLQDMQQALPPAAHYDVILLNSGIHDMQHPSGPCDFSVPPRVPLAEYRVNIEAAMLLAKQHTDNVIWVDTTPVTTIDPDHICARPGDQLAYNALAHEIAGKYGLRVLPMGSTFDQLTNNVHYGRFGYAVLGQRVAECVEQTVNGANDSSCSVEK